MCALNDDIREYTERLKKAQSREHIGDTMSGPPSAVNESIRRSMRFVVR